LTESDPGVIMALANELETQSVIAAESSSYQFRRLRSRCTRSHSNRSNQWRIGARPGADPEA